MELPEEKRRLQARRNANNMAAQMLVDVVDRKPHELSSGFMKRLSASMPDVPEEEIYISVLETVCGLNPDSSERDAILCEEYIDRCVRHLDAESYSHDPYLRNIKVPTHGVRGGWEFGVLRHEPYELFPLGLLEVEGNREVPLMGYFSEPFECPVVKQDGREWMAVKPSEMLTMREPLERMHGRVAVFGLGLGYFAYMASLKPEVTDMTVVEIDADAISLFKEYILPQFGDGASKVHVVHADAFEFERTMRPGQYDCIFVDLWHDAGDGLPLYEKFISLLPAGVVGDAEYWIEPLLKSAQRWNED